MYLSSLQREERGFGPVLLRAARSSGSRPEKEGIPSTYMKMPRCAVSPAASPQSSASEGGPSLLFLKLGAYRMEKKKRPRPITGGALPLLCPKLMEQWDYERNAGIDPMTLRRGSMKRVSWKCQNGHSWEDTVSHRMLERIPCPICGAPKFQPGESLAEKRPDLVRQWDVNKSLPYYPTSVSAESTEIVWWRCGQPGHNWCAAIYDRAVHGQGCPYCEGRLTLPEIEDEPTNQ